MTATFPRSEHQRPAAARVVRVRDEARDELDRLWGTHEAARFLGLADSTVSKHALKGNLVPVLVVETDGARYFDPDDVRGLPDRMRRGHGPECPYWTDSFSGGSLECQCVLCHCGEDHQPGGVYGQCLRCDRKRYEDLLTHRSAS